MSAEARTEAIKAHREAADAKVKAAIAQYRAEHPECAEKNINIISVRDEKSKEAIENAGQRTGQRAVFRVWFGTWDKRPPLWTALVHILLGG